MTLKLLCVTTFSVPAFVSFALIDECGSIDSIYACMYQSADMCDIFFEYFCEQYEMICLFVQRYFFLKDKSNPMYSSKKFVGKKIRFFYLFIHFTLNVIPVVVYHTDNLIYFLCSAFDSFLSSLGHTTKWEKQSIFLTLCHYL